MFTFIESSVFERVLPSYLNDGAKYDNVPAHILKQLLEAFRNG